MKGDAAGACGRGEVAAERHHPLAVAPPGPAWEPSSMGPAGGARGRF